MHTPNDYRVSPGHTYKSSGDIAKGITVNL